MGVDLKEEGEERGEGGLGGRLGREGERWNRRSGRWCGKEKIGEKKTFFIRSRKKRVARKAILPSGEKRCMTMKEEKQIPIRKREKNGTHRNRLIVESGEGELKGERSVLRKFGERTRGGGIA